MQRITFYHSIAGFAPNLRPPPLAFCASTPLARYAAESSPGGYQLRGGVVVAWTYEKRPMSSEMRRGRRVAYSTDNDAVQTLEAVRWWLDRQPACQFHHELCQLTGHAFVNPKIPGCATKITLQSNFLYNDVLLNDYHTIAELDIRLSLCSLRFENFTFTSLRTVIIMYAIAPLDLSWLPACSVIDTLVIGYCRGEWHHIGALKSLTELRLCKLPLDDGIRWLAGCTRLKTLSMSECWAPMEEDWQCIGALRDLETLDLSRSTVPSLDFLKHTEWLQEATLEDCGSITDWEPIGRLRNLKKLDLSGNLNRVSSIEWVTGCVSLEEVLLSRYGPVENWEPLTTLPKLRRILIAVNSTIQSVEWINRCKALDALSVYGCPNIADAHSIRDHPTLRSIFWVSAGVSDHRLVASWATCPSLVELILDSYFETEDFTPLGVMTSLRTLVLPPAPDRSPECRRGAGGLMQRFRDKVLCTSTTRIREHSRKPSLSWIRHCTQLEELTFGRNFDVADWDVLKALENLRSFRASYTKVDTVEWVAHCPRLEILCLRHCKRVADWTPLCRARCLRTLVVSDSCLTSLSKLGTLTQLRELDVSGCKLKDWEQLRAFPRLQRLNARDSNLNTLSWLPFLPNLETLEVYHCTRLRNIHKAQLAAVKHRLSVIGTSYQPSCRLSFLFSALPICPIPLSPGHDTTSVLPQRGAKSYIVSSYLFT